jgi:hypothetical protein
MGMTVTLNGEFVSDGNLPVSKSIARSVMFLFFVLDTSFSQAYIQFSRYEPGTWISISTMQHQQQRQARSQQAGDGREIEHPDRTRCFDSSSGKDCRGCVRRRAGVTRQCTICCARDWGKSDVGRVEAIRLIHLGGILGILDKGYVHTLTTTVSISVHLAACRLGLYIRCTWQRRAPRPPPPES